MQLQIESRKLSPDSLKLMDKRAKKLQPLLDIKRIPYKITIDEGFSRYIADQQ